MCRAFLSICSLYKQHKNVEISMSSTYIQSVKKDGKESESTYNICYVINNDSCSSTSIVHWGQTVVSFLPSCIPNFKLHRYIIHSQCLGEKCCTNCRLLCRSTKDVLKPQVIKNLIATNDKNLYTRWSNTPGSCADNFDNKSDRLYKAREMQLSTCAIFPRCPRVLEP
jgi:hypothetical protein